MARLCPGAAHGSALAGCLRPLRRAAGSHPAGGGVRHLRPARLAPAPGRAGRGMHAPLRRGLHQPLHGAGLGRRLWRLHRRLAARVSRATLARRGRARARLDETEHRPAATGRPGAARTGRRPADDRRLHGGVGCDLRPGFHGPGYRLLRVAAPGAADVAGGAGSSARHGLGRKLLLSRARRLDQDGGAAADAAGGSRLRHLGDPSSTRRPQPRAHGVDPLALCPPLRPVLRPDPRAAGGRAPPRTAPRRLG